MRFEPKATEFSTTAELARLGTVSGLWWRVTRVNFKPSEGEMRPPRASTFKC